MAIDRSDHKSIPARSVVELQAPPKNEGRLDLLAQSNPGAEFAGYLTLYSEQTDVSFVEDAVSPTLATFDRLPDNMEVHMMMCHMRLVEMRWR